MPFYEQGRATTSKCAHPVVQRSYGRYGPTGSCRIIIPHAATTICNIESEMRRSRGEGQCRCCFDIKNECNCCRPFGQSSKRLQIDPMVRFAIKGAEKHDAPDHPYWPLLHVCCNPQGIMVCIRLGMVLILVVTPPPSSSPLSSLSSFFGRCGPPGSSRCLWRCCSGGIRRFGVRDQAAVAGFACPLSCPLQF